MTKNFWQVDPEIAQRLLDGSEGAFESFVTAYKAKLFQYSFLMCGHREDAEEVAQETLLRVFQSLDQLRDPARLKPWVFRIAKNACLMKRRRSVFAPAVELSLDELKPRLHGEGESAKLEIADWSALPEDEAFKSEMRNALTAAIGGLPVNYRSVVLLRDIEGLSTEDTAEILEVRIDTVKTRLHRARLELRKQMDQFLRSAKGAPVDARQ